MAVPKNASDAIAGRLLSYAPLTALVENRITPNIPDQEPEGPYVVFWDTSGGAGSALDGPQSLRAYTYRIEVYAKTDADAEEILARAMERLCGNPRKGLPVWREMTDGVQGCFPAEDKGTDILDDGTPVKGQSVSLWFCPQV